MKKMFYSLFAGLLLFSGCSQEEASVESTQQTTLFTLSLPHVQGAATRGAVAPARYVMEVWSEDGTTPENVFEDGTNQAVITSGNSFSATLDKTKAYTCLFWGDDNETFDASALKNISPKSDKEVNEAFYAMHKVEMGLNPAVAVVLRRAVAKVTLAVTGSVADSEELHVSFSNIYPAFNVFEGGVAGTAADWSNRAAEVAALEASATPASFYFFANTTAALTELTFSYGAGEEKTVSNVPYQQNYVTNISGDYSNIFEAIFTVTVDDAWNSENEGEGEGEGEGTGEGDGDGTGEGDTL